MRREGAPSWIDVDLLAQLDGRLWHASDANGWAGIRRTGAIIADAKPHYPNGFCRSIGAVSLFDLAQPDSASSVAAAHWSQWLGAVDEEPRYWIEIDRSAVAPQLLTPADTLARWRNALDEGSPNLRIISGLEAAHLGRVPLQHTRRVIECVSGRLRETWWTHLSSTFDFSYGS